MTPEIAIAALGLTVTSEFVPFSKSRNADSDWQSLNWKVTVQRQGRDVLTTDYSAGSAHCPINANLAKIPPEDRWGVVKMECECGYAVKYYHGRAHPQKGKKIEPNPVDVLYSLTMDSDVLNYAGFEDWADSFGYDSDSRAAESTYRACLDIALQFRAAIGDSGMDKLAEAFQDY